MERDGERMLGIERLRMRISEHRPESWRSALRRGAKSEQAPNEVAGAVASDPDEGDRLLDGGANAPAGVTS